MVGFGLEPNVSPWQLPVVNSHPQYVAMIYKHFLPRVVVEQDQMLSVLIFVDTLKVAARHLKRDCQKSKVIIHHLCIGARTLLLV